MSPARLATTALAACAVFVTAAICVRILGNRLYAALMALSLALVIPWTKPFPAVGPAAALLLTLAFVYAWLYAAKGPARRLRRGLYFAALEVFLMPEIILLPLAAVAVEGLRRRRVLPGLVILKAASLIILAALVRATLAGIFLTSPVGAAAGLLRRVAAGTAWDGYAWTVAGSAILRDYEMASALGRYFYWPLIPPIMALSWHCRLRWWFTPVFAWGAIVTLLTFALVDDTSLRACPPLAAALLVPFSLAALASLSGKKHSRSRLGGKGPADPPQSPMAL